MTQIFVSDFNEDGAEGWLVKKKKKTSR